MKYPLLCIAVSLALSLLACTKADPNKQVDEGKVQGDVYTSAEIGWTIHIPDGWSVVSKDKREESSEKGMEAIGETYGGDLDYSGLKHLISFQKDQFNIFQSTSEPFELEYEGEWEENNVALRELIYTTYINQGLTVDTSSSTQSIDGLEFATFHVAIYGSEGDVILYQDLYSRYINGLDFGVNLNYNNEENKKIMMTAWENSKFTIR